MIKIDEVIPLLKPGFVAMDKDNQWWWYVHKPMIDKDNWHDSQSEIMENLTQHLFSFGSPLAPFDGSWKDSLIEIKPMGKKTSEWHISDCIKTDEDAHNLLEAEREPYEKALRAALATLQVLASYPEDEKLNYYGGLNDNYRMSKDMSALARRCCERVVTDLKKEGIPDPTDMKEEK